MKEKTEEQKGGILWIDPSVDYKGNVVFMTQVVDGNKFKISPCGRTYCAGAYKEEK